jgi:hypothetical protein
MRNRAALPLFLRIVGLSSTPKILPSRINRSNPRQTSSFDRGVGFSVVSGTMPLSDVSGIPGKAVLHRMQLG